MTLRITVLATVASALLSGAAFAAVDANGLAVGAILSPAQPPGSIVVSPGDNVSALVAAAPAGTVFWFKPGVYRGQSFSPKDDQQFIGAAGAYFNGAVIVTAAPSGGRWVISNAPRATTGNGSGECASGYPRCGIRNDLFVTTAPGVKMPLRHVGSLAAVNAPGTYYHGGTTITMFDDPAGRQLEVSSTPWAVAPTGKNVVIRNLNFSLYATEAQMGAIGRKLDGNASGWTLENLTVRWSHGTGVSLPTGSTLTKSYIFQNGEVGVGSGNGASNLTVSGNAIEAIGYAGFDCGWSCGGSKMGDVHGAAFTANHVYAQVGNRAPGLWCDEDCTDVVYDGNYVHDNPGQGIFYEISCRATIKNNRISGNGFSDSTGWFWPDAILISASHTVEVFGNTLADNYRGVVGVNQDRLSGARCGLRLIHDLNVYDNTTTLTGRSVGASALISDDAPGNIFDPAKNNRWTSNHYHLGNVFDEWFNWNDQDMTAVQWRANAGQDLTGTFEP